jgi:hypothetical protein
MGGAMPAAMRWSAEGDTSAFEGGEFCCYAIETRLRCEAETVQQCDRLGIEERRSGKAVLVPRAQLEDLRIAHEWEWL